MSYRINATATGGDDSNPYGGADKRFAAWQAVLERFERNLDAADDYLKAVDEQRGRMPEQRDGEGSADSEQGQDTAPREAPAPPAIDFTPPTDLGPIPKDFELRARAILDRQAEISTRMRGAAGLAKKHATAAEAMRQHSDSVPLYFDLDA